MEYETQAQRRQVANITPHVRATLLLLCSVVLDTATPVTAMGEPPPPPVAKAGRPTAGGPSANKTRMLGVVLFDGFEVLDVYGPLEMWGSLGPQIKVVTIAKRAGPVASAQGAQTLAEFSFGDAPALDLILAPGGAGVRSSVKDGEVLSFLRARAKNAEIVMSVCNGAWILAAAGLLDGRPATTNKAYWERAMPFGPKVRWLRHARWVDDGNRVTSSGVSAGIDMSLHLIARLFGTQAAEDVAKGTEYEWHRDPDWDPFAAAAQ